MAGFVVFYLIGAAIIAIHTYIVWFRYDVYMRLYGLARIDPDMNSFYSFRRWLMLAKPTRILMRVFHTLFLLLWLVIPPFLILILTSP